MSEIRWHQALEDITKVEYKYNIKNPLWDSEGWKGVFREYGFVPVDAKGEWWTRIPGSPEIPIICAPLVTTSATTSGAIAGTSATALIETATPIIDVTYTEVAGGATASVTTGGAVTSVSSAVATGAIGAAIGFGVGVGGFELAPEFWTNVSNTVFGTNLSPSEIGKMTKDTNALAIIKEGVVYFAEDMINAIRNVFFDFGADQQTIITPQPTGEYIEVLINNLGGPLYSISYLKSYFTGDFIDGATELLNEFLSNGVFYYWNFDSGAYGASKRITGICFTNLTMDPTDTKVRFQHYTSKINVINGSFYKSTSSVIGGTLKSITIYQIDDEQIGVNYSTNDTTSIITLGECTFEYNNSPGKPQHTVSSINATIEGNVPSVTPSGNQGTKSQTISELFPAWKNKAIQTIAGDGETKVDWLPVSIPNYDPIIDGNPLTMEKAQEGILPDDNTETLGQIADNTQEITTNTPNYPTPPIPPEPTITPTPNPPILSGAASIGLANLYNPTLAQLKEFSRWLWGADFNLEQLKKLFQDPMQAIIGLHVLYATPTTGSEEGIQLGYINSGVNSKTVTKQYIDIDCGTVTINEYFGDARDYSPFTQTFCYLPFIGIVELNADDVINSNLTIKYRIDVLTGCCLAQLTVKKFGLDAVLYTYTGNCAVQMPITSGSYLSTITSLLGAVAGVVGGALTGGVAGAVAGGVRGASNIQKASISMSGSLGSNAGAMGIRKPYIIIKRVEEADASGYNEFYGYPTNRRALLSDLSGFVRVKDINLSGVTATAEEQAEIITLLKEGVII